MPREYFERGLRDLQGEVLVLGSMVDKAIARSVDALKERDMEAARHVIEEDEILDERRAQIERQGLLLIATQQPLAGDLRTIAAVLSIASELERMGDYAEGIAKISIDMASEPPVKSLLIIPRMAEKARDMLRRSLDAFVNRDVDAAKEVWSEDDEIDSLYDRVYHELLAVMISDPSTISGATRLLWVSHNLERIADRVTNICERTGFMVAGHVPEDMTVQS